MTNETPSRHSDTSALTIDHLAYFVPEVDGASAALTTLGFTLTPFSAQSMRSAPDAPLVPAGTGNRCVMLQRGYLEFLAPTHDTPNAKQLRTAINRYTGLHLIAFGTDDAHVDHERLVKGEFDPLPPIALQREVGTETGNGTARFTVVRVPPEVMAEGRIQYCQHHTPELVWQARWINHRNGITGLAGAMVCVADPEQAAQRYARFTGLPVHRTGSIWQLDTARGYLLFGTPQTISQWLGVTAPAVPWIACTILESVDFPLTTRVIRESKMNTRALAGDCVLVELPPALGGFMVVQNAGTDILRRSMHS